MVHVCVIGGGAAGLCAMHRLSKLEGFTGVVFEQTAELGGIWVYEDPLIESKENKFKHSVMYRDCRTNLPKEIMHFMDYPFTEGKHSFLTHEEVKQYLNDYADHFDIRKYVQFNTQVTKVTPVLRKNGERKSYGPAWVVRVTNLVTEEEQYHDFDAVLVCNGHHYTPQMPELPGSECFDGKISFASEYRFPETFKNKRVVIVGAGPSAMDLSLEICEVTPEVVVSMKTPPWKSPVPENIIQKPLIKQVVPKGVQFQNGEYYECDEILICVGYQYEFPFLSEECEVTIDDGKRVDPIYRHVLHMKYPTMAFIGLPYHCIPFHMFDIQIRWYLSFLSGERKFPSLEEMQNDRAQEEEDRKGAGFQPHHGHRLAVLQFKYYEKLATEAGFQDELKPVTQKVMEFVTNRRFTCATDYKRDIIKLLDRENFAYNLVAADYREC